MCEQARLGCAQELSSRAAERTAADRFASGPIPCLMWQQRQHHETDRFLACTGVHDVRREPRAGSVQRWNVGRVARNAHCSASCRGPEGAGPASGSSSAQGQRFAGHPAAVRVRTQGARGKLPCPHSLPPLSWCNRPTRSTPSLPHRLSPRRRCSPARSRRRGIGSTPTNTAGFRAPQGASSTAVGAEPYVYLYTPSYGWTWYVSPWGFGPDLRRRLAPRAVARRPSRIGHGARSGVPIRPRVWAVAAALLPRHGTRSMVGCAADSTATVAAATTAASAEGAASMAGRRIPRRRRPRRRSPLEPRLREPVRPVVVPQS